ncbi:hypothetical protein DMN91_005917 [Ooceraea biroi]|uniref:Uncharacterized protein n=1 Tax=Ooceraea biroi TaxID=2015173 RepID=A0A3L8DM88_OOCBI|nr:hypothetical protein DMN91_005917 [Ooceraea biroi]
MLVAIIHGILLDTNDAEICNLLCEQCNASAVFSDDYCECNFSDDNDEGTECIQRLQREIQTIDLNVLSDDLTDEERSVRSILKSRRRLRMGDADKVAQYFINGGPSAGHSHFFGAYNAAYDSADPRTNSFSGVADKNNPESEFYDDVSSHVSLTSPISRSTYNSPLYVLPEAAKHEDPATLDARERSLTGSANSVLNYPPNGWYDLLSPLLGTYPYGGYRYGVPLHHSVLRTATLPSQLLHNLFAHRLPNRYPMYHGSIVRSANPLQDSLPFVDRSCKNVDDDAALYDSSTARNNADKSVAYNVGESIPGSDFPVQFSQFIKPYIFGTDTLHQPMQYRYFGSPNPQYPYYNPLISVLNPLNGYILQPIPQSLSDQLISAPNPTSCYTNNANSEQRSDAAVLTDKIVNADDKTKGLNIIADIISKEENKADSGGSQ